MLSLWFLARQSQVTFSSETSIDIQRTACPYVQKRANSSRLYSYLGLLHGHVEALPSHYWYSYTLPTLTSHVPQCDQFLEMLGREPANVFGLVFQYFTYEALECRIHSYRYTHSQEQRSFRCKTHDKSLWKFKLTHEKYFTTDDNSPTGTSSFLSAPQ
jgi:hypothetical protein